MSDRRRRRAKEEDSDVESESSEEENSDSESESESSEDADNNSPPNYDEAVQLENDTKEDTVESKSTKKQRPVFIKEKKDPSFVPRSERFFLHDNREDQGSDSRGQRKGKQGNTRGRTRPNKSEDDDLDWKHDKYEELIANEPEEPRKDYKQKHDSRMGQKASKKYSRDEVNSGKMGKNTPGSATKPPRGPPAQPSTDSTPRKSDHYRESTQTTTGTDSKGSKEAYHTSADRHTPSSSRKPAYNNKDHSTKESQHSKEFSKETETSKEYTKKTPTKGPLARSHKNTAESTPTSTSKRDYATGKGSATKTATFTSTGSATKATQPTTATAKSTPVKAPPGLDSAVLNPGAREFQPTDDATTRHSPSPTPSGTTSHSSGRGKWKYGADPASYSYATEGVAPVVAAYIPVTTVPPVQQTVTFRGVSAPESPAVPATSSIPSTPVPPTQQQVSYKEHSPHIKYPSAGSTPQTAAPAVQHPRPADFHPTGRPVRSPAAHHPAVIDPSADMYGMAMQHSGMMYRGSYMGMPPMYDPQMMYMNDPSMMQSMVMGRGMSHHSMSHHPHMHSHHAAGGEYGDGTVWYSSIPTQSIGGMPGADGTAVSGGTVYYPLPPSAPTSE